MIELWPATAAPPPKEDSANHPISRQLRSGMITIACAILFCYTQRIGIVSQSEKMRLPREMVEVRRSAIDLMDMESIDASEVVTRLSKSDVVWAFYPAGKETILKWYDSLWHESLGQHARVNAPTSPTMTAVLVDNMMQAEIVIAALEMMAAGTMGPKQVENFKKMLTATQDVDCTAPAKLDEAWVTPLRRGGPPSPGR